MKTSSGCISVVAVFIIAAVMATSAMAFGTYSKAYLDRQDAKRWAQLCKGGGRYQAMAEAYNKGKRDPCQPVASKR